MPKIFICYRREDSAHQAGRLFDRLIAKFGAGDVFKDVDSIPLGLDFRQVLETKVSQCNVLLVLVGDQWSTAATPGGTRRLDDPDDFVRIEIESALRRSIPVIPLLLDNTPIPSVKDLPPGLEGLAYRNGMALRSDPDFHRDVDRLVQGIAAVAPAHGILPLAADGSTRPAALSSRRPGLRRKIAALILIPALIVVAIILYRAFIRPVPPDPDFNSPQYPSNSSEFDNWKPEGKSTPSEFESKQPEAIMPPGFESKQPEPIQAPGPVLKMPPGAKTMPIEPSKGG